ncbi:hypothetical protein BAUCODRAFT_435816 [Baudoinia panamericana UAMH 10762]|uniref:UFSP1/2/DUB catalytic domain-containing protein n=1 Tax=Baudoinia panamericana (strain UAMH 10762) TaxID=717646 RepID=M2NCW1_BAUPA|nr:uncharacterized protein BAUCODRAFT_435816 [Baudoinia panamericana UAMH 10762]EMC97024.1 hypothetical protein BAUCODRAFT_435816 [Baudoinia panamericana UAMH 10762]
MAKVSCPFCGVTSPETLVIQAHIEEQHYETPNQSSVYKAREGSRVDSRHALLPNLEHKVPESEPQWTKCTRPGCGEYVLLRDIDEHLDVHAALAASETERSNFSNNARNDNQPPSPRRAKLDQSRRRPSNAVRSPSTQSILSYFAGRSSYASNAVPKPPQAPRPSGRLGKRELGPHAWEKRMPDIVRQRLLTAAVPRQVNKLGRDGRLARETVIDNETMDLVPLIAELCSRDRDTVATYLCHPAVNHVAKIRCDGNFCGYWSIQVLLTHLLLTRKAVFDAPRVPNVLQIQDRIEQAWDAGVCAYGRTETGGIRGTRKWIGTAEAVSFFTQMGVPCQPLAFEDDDDNEPYGELAAIKLLDYVEVYFMQGQEAAQRRGSSFITQLPPLYFQRLGHSMSIVGVERQRDGKRNLLVFDSSFETSAGVTALLAGRSSRAERETLLKAYRRSDRSLARWEEFEVITLS